MLGRLRKTRTPAAAALANCEVSINIIDDQEMCSLNAHWRQKDKTTDVLSFPQFSVKELKNLSPKSGAWTLGDIVISYPVALRQSREIGHSLFAEMDRLLAHGLLHLLGYDHEISALEERRMKRLENKLLTR